MASDDASTTIAVIVVAAGEGTRLGASVPKAFAPLASGTVLESAIRGVRGADIMAQCIVVTPKDHVEATLEIARSIYGADHSRHVTVLPGGRERADSVIAGLRALAPGITTVLVHDAARALTPSAQFELVASLVHAHQSGVVPVLPVVDTVKRVTVDAEVVDTLDRRELVLAQTPQGFPRAMIEQAYESAQPDPDRQTDDAAIVAAAGHRVVTAPGHELAFKITTPDDLRRADTIARSAGAALEQELRTGVGVDAHRFEVGIPLWLGGIEWPDAPAGLAGHSDGDVACHAIVDALLSAAGLGDIGTMFGVDDPARLGTRGAEFIRETVARLDRDGWRIRSVAVEVIANTPRIGPRRDELERTLSALVAAPVSVAGTTSDGLGLTGDGSGVAAVATALVARDRAG